MEPQKPFGADTSLTRGIVIGLLIIAGAVLVGGLYLWGSMLNQPAPQEPIPENHEPETPRADADIQILSTVSSSDDISAIEADLNSTNLDNLDQETALIDNDLNQ